MRNVLKLAVPVHANRISPLFDTSTSLIVVEIADGGETDRRLLDIKRQGASVRPKSLENMEVNVLICGAISGSLQRRIEFLNIEVIPCVAGEVDDVIAAYIEQRLGSAAFRMPGCGGRKSRCAKKRSGGVGSLEYNEEGIV